jgi:hypothetical protein
MNEAMNKTANKKLPIIIGLQALLIVVLFWMLIFYGQDEYEEYRLELEEEIESPSRVTEENGINMVTLPLATQQNSGIKTAKIIGTSYQGEIKSFGNVVPIDTLIQAKAQYLNLQSSIQLARASSVQKTQQYQRLKMLNADDKNVSDLAVQESLTSINTDNASITAAELQLKNLQTSLQLQWGKELAKIALNEKLPPHLANLLNKNSVLVQVNLPLNTLAPPKNSTVTITPLTDSSQPIKAVYVSAATTSDTNGLGNTFFYSAPASLLRIGMRVNVELEAAASDATDGVIIPSNAVVWYAGKSWAYFKKNKDNSNINQFIRKPVATDTEIEAGWFNQGIEVGSEIVISGAQLLLSEEFKYLIKNENED